MTRLIRRISRSGFNAQSTEAEERVMTNNLDQTQEYIEAH